MSAGARRHRQTPKRSLDWTWLVMDAIGAALDPSAQFGAAVIADRQRQATDMSHLPLAFPDLYSRMEDDKP